MIRADCLPPRTTQTSNSNKRVPEEGLTFDRDGENGLISREVKRHQPLPLENSTVSPSRSQIVTSSREFDSTVLLESTAHFMKDEILPEKTFIIRNIAEDATTSDITSLLSPFSIEPPVVTFLGSGEALVVMEDLSSVDRAVQYLNLHKPQIRDSPVTASFSTTTERALVSDVMPVSKTKTDPQALRVLLVTITDIRHPVDIELLYRLFCVYGTIEKVVTFVKTSNRHQALIQFAEARQAREAANSLNNKCIFDGCNKIQIQSSKLSQLVVKQNNQRSWDFTSAPLLSGNHLATTSSTVAMSMNGLIGALPTSDYNSISTGPLIPNPSYLSTPQPLHAQLLNPIPTSNQSCVFCSFSATPTPSLPTPISIPFGSVTAQPFTSSAPTSTGSTANTLSPISHPQLSTAQLLERLPRELQNASVLHQVNPGQTTVVICYNLPALEITVHKLFNLLSLYGVVLRIKLLRDKPDTALAQYSHPLYATLACHFLAGAPIFGTDAGLQIGISKKTEVKLPPLTSLSKEAAEEAQRTVAFHPQDQRARPEEIDKFIRGACKPTNTLFIANLHESIKEETLRDLLSTIGTVVKLEMRPPKQQSKRITAMAEMSSEKEALTAICHLHNHQLANCNIKLAFSKQVLA